MTGSTLKPIPVSEKIRNQIRIFDEEESDERRKYRAENDEDEQERVNRHRERPVPGKGSDFYFPFSDAGVTGGCCAGSLGSMS